VDSQPAAGWRYPGITSRHFRAVLKRTWASKYVCSFFIVLSIYIRFINYVNACNHAFVASRVDCCNTVLAGAPRSLTHKLQRVLNAAARVVSNTRKHDHGLSELLHDELHWSDILQRVDYKLCMTVSRCLQRKAPPYLADLCTPFSDIASRQHLYVRLEATSSMFHVTIARSSAVGPFLLRVRWPGTHCQTALDVDIDVDGVYERRRSLYARILKSLHDKVRY